MGANGFLHDTTQVTDIAMSLQPAHTLQHCACSTRPRSGFPILDVALRIDSAQTSCPPVWLPDSGHISTSLVTEEGYKLFQQQCRLATLTARITQVHAHPLAESG